MQPDLIQSVLMYFILPLWLLSATADYFCHRASEIEKTAGPKETYIHLLGIAEMGIPVLAALFLEINSLIIAIMIFFYLLHEMTTYWDVAYAHSVRDVSPIEQHVHNYLATLPFMALVLVVVLHWGQFTSLFGLGIETADFGLRWKSAPLPILYISSVLILVVLIDLIPFAEELVRSLRVTRTKKR